MKRRLFAVLLAAGLSVSSFSMGVFAGETEAVTEQTTEAEPASESISEAVGEVEDAAGAESEAAAEGAVATIEDQAKTVVEQLLSQLSAMSDEQLESMMDSGDATYAKLAYNWQGVKQDLGNFIELETPVVTQGTDAITAVAAAKYDGVEESATVNVTFEQSLKDGTFDIQWEVDYPMSTLMKQAALNTLMGVGIVFLVLFFLSILIGKLHIIPDMIEARSKKAEPAAPAAPAAAPAPAASVAEEEDLVDDCELVAVIAAAIAAAENTSTDGFVVRSIRKANKRNWQRA